MGNQRDGVQEDGVQRVLMLLYSLALTVGLAAWTLRYVVPIAIRGRWPAGLREKFGRVPEALGHGLQGRRVVWIHAVSVGEVLAASRLVEELRTALGDGFVVYVSTTTDTGQKLARERFGAERVFYMPLDFAFAVRAYLRVLKPAAVVLMESEVWPRMMHECRKAGAPVVVVNARVSDRSFGRSVKVRWIWSRVLRQATLWLAQSEEDARRLVAMGARPEAVRVGGNLKYDVRAPKVSRVAELIREVAAGRPVIVAGSTVARLDDKSLSEDEMMIQAWEGGPRRDLGALLVLAPRHRERFAEVQSVAIEFPTLLATEMLAGKQGSEGFSVRLRERERASVEIVVLDTIGDLAAVYGIADVAFVGGSMIERGGHNPLEPAQFGVPVVMGPSFENFRDIIGKMRAAGGISILGEAAGLSTALRSGRDDTLLLKDALETELIRLLADREAAHEMGERGRQVFEQEQGATGRAVEAVVEMIRSGASI